MVTWLNANTSDTELGFTNFPIFRLDRNSNTSSYSRGGGTLIAAKIQYNLHY